MSDNKNTWGTAPQESTTDNHTPKPGWGSSPQESTTGYSAPKNSWGSAPQESTTGSPKPKSGTAKATCPIYSFYVLGGVTFRVRRVISEHSGESVIFEVENDGNIYALKLYRSGIVPDHDVLQRIMDKRGNGLLIDIYAHGVWHDDAAGGDYHYEVMQHCTGGSLAAINIRGDEPKLREYAVRMASAVDFAHSIGVLHRDVKPANFLFVDKEQTRFVLTDWGLAKTLDKDRRTPTDGGRTKIYAAPEMYTYIPGTPTYIGPKADFFSMGMALMALWMGEGKLLADETKLVHDKQEETLPYPRRGEMSDHTLGLIKALTRRNPDNRAGFDEVLRWAKGENIFTHRDDNVAPEFSIIFNASAGLTAHSPKELSDMMWANKDLATKYLYSDTIAKWFHDIKRPEIAVTMEDITENRFPGDRSAGLYAACLTLNPEMPFWFTTPRGMVEVKTLDELGDAFAEGRLGSDDVKTVTSQQFLMWAATRDAALAGKAIKAKGGYKALFALLPGRGFDYRPLDKSSLATPEQLGQRIMDELSGAVVGNDVSSGVVSDCLLRDNRLCSYLRSKGIYDKQLSYIQYCMDLGSADNKKKFVPYTQRVAKMKAAAGLMGRVPVLTVGDIKFKDEKDVAETDMSLFDADEQDIVADWLSLFYQENPYSDYKKKSYLDLAAEYGDAINALPDCSYNQQAADGLDNISVALEANENMWDKIKIWRRIGLIILIPLVIIILTNIYLVISTGSDGFQDTMSRWGHGVGVCVGILAGLCILGEYGFILSFIGGAICYVIVKMIFGLLGTLFPWIIIAFMICAAIYFSKRIFHCPSKTLKDNYTSMDWDEVVERYFIGLRFGCTNKVFPENVPSDYPLCVIDENSMLAIKEVKTARRCALLMLILTVVGVLWCGYLGSETDKTSVIMPPSIEQRQDVRPRQSDLTTSLSPDSSELS